MRKLYLLMFATLTLSAFCAFQQVRILKILQEADQPTPAPSSRAKVDIKNAPILGNENAPVTIVEFTDFQCPFCSKFHTDTFPPLHDEYITTGRVRLVHRDFPLQIHKDAMQAAEAGRCARDQQHFWEMRDWMQSNPTKLSIIDLQSHANKLGLDPTEYRICMTLGKYKKDIEAEIKEAQNLGLNGTPAFIIGKSGSVIDGDILLGSQPLKAFEDKINALL